MISVLHDSNKAKNTSVVPSIMLNNWNDDTFLEKPPEINESPIEYDDIYQGNYHLSNEILGIEISPKRRQLSCSEKTRQVNLSERNLQSAGENHGKFSDITMKSDLNESKDISIVSSIIENCQKNESTYKEPSKVDRTIISANKGHPISSEQNRQGLSSARKSLKSARRNLKSAQSITSNNSDILNDEDLTIREDSEKRLFALITFWTLAVLVCCTALTIPIYKTYMLNVATIVLDYVPEDKKGIWGFQIP